MNEDQNDSETKNQTKLYLPRLCIVPLAARLDNTLSDSAKIYLGELNTLTNKFGYCTATDEQLAEMKGVSVRTIKLHNKELSDRGFIFRNTWRKHVKNPKGSGIIIRSQRKMYVIEDPSNKVAEGQKIALLCEGQKIALLNKELEKKNKNNVKTPPPSPKKNNVKTERTLLPSSKEVKKEASKKSFRDCLPTQEHKDLHDKIVGYKCVWGDPPDSKTVCGWMLSKSGGFSLEQVEKAFAVYLQDAVAAERRGDSVRSMGACMRHALREGRQPNKPDFACNKEMAEKYSVHPQIEVKQNYAVVDFGGPKEEYMFNLPTETFQDAFTRALEKLDSQQQELEDEQ